MYYKCEFDRRVCEVIFDYNPIVEIGNHIISHSRRYVRTANSRPAVPLLVSRDAAITSSRADEFTDFQLESHEVSIYVNMSFKIKVFYID